MRHLALVLFAALTATACASTTLSCPLLIKDVNTPVPCHPTEPPPLCAAAKSYPFQNLVLEGGGVKGIAYAGAFKALADQGILDNVGSVAGTSAGAITATLVALRYTPAQIQSLISRIQFQKFEDGGATGIFRLFERFGWYKGDYLLDLMRCLIGNQTGKPRATFKDLKDGQDPHHQHFLDLHVFSTDLSTGLSKELSARKETENVEVALAVRMSMSIPLFFASVNFQNDVIVDGGVLRNYPIDAFDQRQSINWQTLGLTLTSGPSPRTQIDSLPRYTQSLFETLLNEQVVDLETNPPDLSRSVLIDDLGISTTDFQITPQQKCELIAKGYECTCRYLSDWQTWPNGISSATNRPGLGRATRLDIIRKCGSAFGPE